MVVRGILPKNTVLDTVGLSYSVYILVFVEYIAISVGVHRGMSLET